MIEFLKNILTDITLRLIVATGGKPLMFKTRYGFMFTVHWEPEPGPATSDAFIIHSRRTYLREPQWHVEATMK